MVAHRRGIKHFKDALLNGSTRPRVSSLSLLLSTALFFLATMFSNVVVFLATMAVVTSAVPSISPRVATCSKNRTATNKAVSALNYT